MRPVITSTLGRCVASTRCMPEARAFCARRAISSSIFLPTTIIRSASSSISDHDVRQPLQRLRCLGREAEGVRQLLAALGRVGHLLVVAGQVAHAQLAHQLVAPLHLAHTPVQRVGGLLHVSHHRRQQVRNAFVHAHLQHLGIDEHQAHVTRLGLVEQRQDHGVDAHRLARAGGAGHQQVGHLGQVGHHGSTDDVLAHAQRELGRRVVVGLRPQDLGQPDGLAPRIGQLQRHVVLARDHLHHADAHEAERARQVLGQAHHLRALHAHRGLDLVARDHGPRRGRDHAHLDAEILELLLDQAAGHLQRLGRHRLHAPGPGIQQVHLRQPGIGQLLEQRLLPLARRPRRLGHLHHGRRNHQRHVVFGVLPLHLDTLFALALRLLAQADVLGSLNALLAPFAPAFEPTADALGRGQPRKAQGQRHAQHQQRDRQHAAAGEADRLHGQWPQQRADHAARVRPRQERLEPVQARPLQCAACQQQQPKPQPGRPVRPQRGRAGLCGGLRRQVRAQQVSRDRQPLAQREHHAPPRRVAEQHVGHVGDPRTGHADLVGDGAAAAGGGKRRVAGIVREQRQHPQQPKRAAEHHAQLQGPARRGTGHRLQGGRGSAFGLDRTQGKRHARYCAGSPEPAARTWQTCLWLARYCPPERRSCSTTQPDSRVSMWPRSSRSFMTRLTISRDAPHHLGQVLA